MVQMSVPILVRSFHQISNDSIPPQLIASILEPVQNVSCPLPVLYMCGERIESRESWPVRKPGRPFATLHVNEPSLRHSQGDIIRGTVQGDAQLQGTDADGRQFPLLPSSSLSWPSKPNMGEIRRNRERSFRSFNCLNVFIVPN